MNWRVEWLAPAAESLRRIPWRDAARVDAAVQQFAAAGRGEVTRLATDDAVTLRLRVPPYVARMSAVREERTLYVWIVYRLR